MLRINSIKNRIIEDPSAMVATVSLQAVGHTVLRRARHVTPGTASLISYPSFNHVGAGSLRVLRRKRLQSAFPLKGCQFVSLGQLPLEIRRLHIKTSNKVSTLEEGYHIPILNANRAENKYRQCP